MVVSFPGVDISADASPSKEERKAARDARRAKNESIRARKSARKEAAESAETSAKVTKQEQGDVLEDLELAAIQVCTISRSLNPLFAFSLAVCEKAN